MLKTVPNSTTVAPERRRIRAQVPSGDSYEAKPTQPQTRTTNFFRAGSSSGASSMARSRWANPPDRRRGSEHPSTTALPS